MEAEGIDVLVVGREGNARYVSGAPRLWTAGSHPFGPGCVLVRSSGAVHLLSTWDEGVPDEIPHENLYGISFNRMTFLKVLQNIEGADSVRTVATDALSPSSALMLPKAFPSADLVDAEPMLRRVRRVKTPDEVEAIRGSVAVAEQSLAAAGMKATRIVPLANGSLQLTFSNVSYAAWAAWLASAEREHGMHAIAVTAHATHTPGNADVELSLRSGRD